MSEDEALIAHWSLKDYTPTCQKGLNIYFTEET